MSQPATSPSRISVGVDGGTGGWEALAWAIEEAALRQAELHVIHCGTSRAVCDTARDQAEQRAPELPIITELSDKPAPEALLDAARHSSMVVVGPPSTSHRLSQLLSRSTALHVAVRTPRTTVIAHRRASKLHAPITMGWIEPSERASAALEAAFREAVLRARPLLVMTVKTSEPHAMLDEVENQYLTMEIEPWRSKYPDVEVQVAVQHGRPYRVLAENSAQAELLVVGERSRSDYLGLHSESALPKLVHDIDCPLMVVHNRV